MSQAFSRSEMYYVAAQERFAEATLLYTNRQFAGACYLAGCAIESTFWAFILESNKVGKGRHDLPLLYREGLGKRLNSEFTEKHRGGAALNDQKLDAVLNRSKRISEYLTHAQARWQNRFRYYPCSALEAIIKKSPGLRKGLGQPFIKGSVNILLEACQFFLELGRRYLESDSCTNG